jgi:hypothetical protein
VNNNKVYPYLNFAMIKQDSHHYIFHFINKVNETQKAMQLAMNHRGRLVFEIRQFDFTVTSSLENNNGNNTNRKR